MIDLNGIKLKNRFLVSAGALEYGRGWPWERPIIKSGLIDPSAFGAVVTKTLTLLPRKGNYIDPFEFEKRPLASHLLSIFSQERKRVLRKIPGGWLNNMAWWNVGIDYWVEEIYSKLKNVFVIPSIGGESCDEYLELIEKLNSLDIPAIELDISCPNIGENHEFTSELPFLFRKAKTISRHPLILKIGASEDYLCLAQTAAASGFKAISAINSLPGAVVINDETFKGGQSGPRIKETALGWIVKLKEKVEINRVAIIGGGGIASWRDCQDFFRIGADAVSFGSIFLSPTRFWLPTWIAKNKKDPK